MINDAEMDNANMPNASLHHYKVVTICDHLKA